MKGGVVSMENNCIGFPWFRQKDYKKLLDIFMDGHLLPENYDEWIKLAEEGLDRLMKDGFTIEMVNIDPVTFPDWCKEKGLNVDANARIAFSDEFVIQKYMGGSG